MSTHRAEVAIIGGGLAAHTAAAVAASAGAQVAMICPPSPGATALWGGLGQAFGPASDFFPRSTGQIGAPPRGARPFDRGRAERFERLLARREFHPYRRLGLSQTELRRTLEKAVSALDYPGLRRVDDERVIPSAAAAPYAADLAASSVLDSAVARGEAVGVLDCPALSDWHAQRLVDALDGLDEVEAHLLEIEPLRALEGRSQHSVRVATRLGDALADDIGVLGEPIERAIERLGLDLVILPPCIGRNWQEHQALFDALAAAMSCRVAESAAARNAIHGWRLDRYLRAHASAEIIGARARSARIVDGRVVSVHTDAGAVQAEAFILATGRFVGGGIPTHAPLREPVLGLDLWLDGAPITDPDQIWPPNLMAEHVFEDHPLFRAGVATDEALRPLGRRAEPVAQNIFAAGRVLAGSNAFVDGTTEGVDLVSGRAAAVGALDVLGHAGSNVDEEVAS